MQRVIGLVFYAKTDSPVSGIRFAGGKISDEIQEIDSELIGTSVVGFPQDQMRCARLSVETFHTALDNYMRSTGGWGKEGSKA